MWQRGYRAETNQADGERLDVPPVGLSLEIVLIGSCSAAATQSLWVQPALCVCVNMCTLQDSCSFLLFDMYVSSAQNGKGDKVGSDGGRVSE